MEDAIVLLKLLLANIGQTQDPISEDFSIILRTVLRQAKITLSEWSFPLPAWFFSLQQAAGRFERQLAAFETLHFVHVLKQIIWGYLW